MRLTIYTQAQESEGGRGYNRERRRSSLAKILTPPREFFLFFNSWYSGGFGKFALTSMLGDPQLGSANHKFANLWS